MILDLKNTVKMAILPKANYKFNVIPMKIPMTLFTELEQIILKFIQNHKHKKQHWKHSTSRLWTTLQSYSDQNSIVLAQKHTHSSVEQNNHTHVAHTHSYGKAGEKTQWRKDSLSSKWCQESWTAMC